MALSPERLDHISRECMLAMLDVLRDRDLAPDNVITAEWVEACAAARQAIALVLSEGLTGSAAAERHAPPWR